MGLSGSGKSTLVRHVNRLVEPTAGEIRVLGEDVRAMSPAALRQLRAERIGMVFQHMALMPHRTVEDNVAYPLELRGTSKAIRWRVAAETLALVGLQGYGDRLPRELSGGMQQRVGLARALAADPAILLMDEPFSALDPLIRRQLQDQFVELSAKLGKTTLFITHDLDEAIRVGSRIAIMKDGRIVQTGTPEEIVTRPSDDYVQSFVQNISKLGLITAQTIMESIAKVEAVQAFDIASAPRARTDANLDVLIGLVTGSNVPVVIDDGGTLVGAVGTVNADCGPARGSVDPVHPVWHPLRYLVCPLKDCLYRSATGAGFHANYAGLCLPNPCDRFFRHRQAAGHHRHTDLWHAARDPVDDLGAERCTRRRQGSRARLWCN